MDEMFEPKRKEKLDKSFFKEFIFLFVVGLFLVVGSSYSLEFFKSNKNVGTINLSTSEIDIDVTGNNSISDSLTKYADSEGLINGLTKELVIVNNNTNYGIVVLKLSRTSGMKLTDMRYALIVNNVITNVGAVPSDGVIFNNVVMGEETVVAKIVF